MVDDERNWARNLTYSAPVQHPGSIEELQDAVAAATRVHALGTRHSFSRCADTDGLLVALDLIEPDLRVDAAAGTATVGAAIRLGDLGRLLDDHGLAIANLPSLPHISLGGAVATATHGSGDGNGMLATLVRGLEVVGPDGAIRSFAGPELAGAVMAYGALGVVTRITVAVEPAFSVRQDPFSTMPWTSVEQHLDAIFAAAYSVSLFTTYTGDVRGGLVKSRDAAGWSGPFFGAEPTPRDPAEIEAATSKTPVGDFGPSWDRLPHFRLAAVPSVGEELQSEYFVPRARAQEALAALRGLGEDIDPALHVTELRTVAADDLWLSPASGADVLAIGFTWRDLPELVLPLLPRIEERILPLGARPHWAKLFAARADVLRERYTGWDDFARLRDEVDPDRVFGNPFLAEVLGS
ncbi:D-arabinono-1,4-lactone oxidase [Amnibacterium kyonggiense]|uniref:Xylitol oxidase n=1 Tax=Amnibacterium kyonggiense TaxID=595671 RepID=A0A4R7FPQ5_9MICO|nr:D-arabinono-1,4-lactone oxidase [Amnibacterium kyonggiense]TDS79693.1 xylitol oxidase [Amnibacterium kyonggiense]